MVVTQLLDQSPACIESIDAVWDRARSFTSMSAPNRQIRYAELNGARLYGFWEPKPRTDQPRRFRVNVCFDGQRVSITETIAEKDYQYVVRGTEQALVEAHLRDFL